MSLIILGLLKEKNVQIQEQVGGKTHFYLFRYDRGVLAVICTFCGPDCAVI